MADEGTTTGSVPEEEIPEDLAAIRHVAATREGKSEFGLIKLYRDLMGESPAEFLRIKSKLEAALLESKGKALPKASGPVEEEEDPGSDRAEELVSRLLDEFEASRKVK